MLFVISLINLIYQDQYIIDIYNQSYISRLDIMDFYHNS